MKKIFGVIYLLISLFVSSEAYSCKHDSDCVQQYTKYKDPNAQYYRCCFDASKAERACIIGCGCNDKDAASCPTGYRCCYDAGIAHHMCISGECCHNEDCPTNYACCKSGKNGNKACYAPGDPQYCDTGE